ncbi:polyphosphate polymerase domain-containing protein [bacterium]|nr:polyphosphate polymerase domain-containing protein [bacterium]MBU1064037.1 polyphosphate polymerase domain-containing protein [bacterium]MBU1635411.1 polyphosphate polymerase domain-containing protein [bacterium]MBU1872312.1 polyphosphate polymerase domain-containing protein [bacterium]
MDDLSTIRRYELKYTITESMASEIRDYISNICSLDPHVPPGDSGYVVNNLYFDTPDLKFYNDTKFRKLTRFKPRARYYGMTVSDFIWPEIKYRHAHIIWKMRYKLPIQDWTTLFYPQMTEAGKYKFKSQLDRFDEIIYWYNAQSKLHVRYFREPFVSNLENYGRITFDRNLCYRSIPGSIDLDYNEYDMLYYDDPITTLNFESPVLLEIKVESLLPWWVVELIRKFNLVQRPFSKYCYGIDHHLTYLTPIRDSIFPFSSI